MVVVVARQVSGWQAARRRARGGRVAAARGTRGSGRQTRGVRAPLASLTARTAPKFKRYFYTYHFSIYIYTPRSIDSVVKCLIVVLFHLLWVLQQLQTLNLLLRIGEFYSRESDLDN